MGQNRLTLLDKLWLKTGMAILGRIDVETAKNTLESLLAKTVTLVIL